MPKSMLPTSRLPLRSLLIACLGLWSGGLGVAYAQSPAMNTAPTARPTLLYVFDALCGWCYAFGPTLAQVEAEFGDAFGYELLSGGLVTGERIGPYGPMAGYIKGALPQVQQAAGVTFGQGFVAALDNPDFVSNSIPPAVALAWARPMLGDRLWAYAHALQQQLFVEGRSLALPDTYAPVNQAFGLDHSAFEAVFAQAMTAGPRTPSAPSAQADFAAAAALGITGYPALVLRKPDGSLRVLTRGFVRFDELAPLLRSLLPSK
jgi:putative protein-disulfide isomerase